MQLSKNFSLKEFTKLPEQQLTPVQRFMLKSICEDVLQPIRDFLGCKIKVTSGLRTGRDRDRLRAAGYNVSETSDHDYGDTVPLNRTDKIARFGGYYSYSVGAADIMPACGAEAAFWKMRQYFNPVTGELNLPEQRVKVSQLILEHGRTYWIHVSNPTTLIYSEAFAQKFLKKNPFLISLDNGASYQSVI